MRFVERFRIQKAENIIFHQITIIALIFLSLLFLHFYLKLSPIFILTSLFAISLFAIILVKAELGLFIFILFVIVEANFFLNLPRAGFVSFPILLEGLMLTAIAFRLFVKKEDIIGKEIQIKLWGIYVLWIILSSLFAYSYHTLNLNYVKELTVQLLSLFLVFTILQKKKDIQNFLYVFVITNILVLISSLMFVLGILKIGISGLEYGDTQRLSGFIQNPNNLSFHLIAFLIINFILFLFTKNSLLKISLIILSFMNLAAIAFTLSRGGFVALIGVLLFLYLKFTRNLRIFFILLLLSLFLYLILPNALFERFEEMGSLQKTDRFILVKVGLNMALSNPIFGVGPGNFNKYVYEYSKLPLYAGKSPHNLYASLSAQYGIPALFLYLFIIFTIWRQLTLIEKYFKGKSLKGNFEYLASIAFKANFVNILLMGLSAHKEHAFLVMFIFGVSIAFITWFNKAKKMKTADLTIIKT